MLGLNKFNQYLAVAKDERVELERRLSVLSSTHAEALNQIARIQSEIANLKADLVARKANSADTEGRKRELEARKEQQLKQLLDRRAELDTLLATARNQVTQAKLKEKSIDMVAARDMASELAMKAKHMSSLAKAPSDCPSCGQPISEHVRI